MKLNASILKILNKTYQPLTLIEARYKMLDLAFKTDSLGRPVLLFIGKKGEDGTVKGERYARVLRFEPDGAVIKDHWDNKGKAT